MKKMKFFAVAAIVIATGSAFAGSVSAPTAATFLSTKTGTNDCDDEDEGTIQECGGSGNICTISNVTYYGGQNCSSVLKFNN